MVSFVFAAQMLAQAMLLSAVRGDTQTLTTPPICEGPLLDFSRFHPVNAVAHIGRTVPGQAGIQDALEHGGEKRLLRAGRVAGSSPPGAGFRLRKVHLRKDNRSASRPCVREYHRYAQTIEGAKIYGAETVVHTDCGPGDAAKTIQGMSGNAASSENIIVEGGFDPTHSPEDAKNAIAESLSVDASNVRDVELEVHLTTEGDFLVYRTQAWVSGQAVDVSVDAHTLNIVSRCETSRNLARQDENEATGRESTTSDAAPAAVVATSRTEQRRAEVTWSPATCTMNTLYLDNNNLQAPCEVGFENGVLQGYRLGPVDSAYYLGTKDCTVDQYRYMHCNLAESTGGTFDSTPDSTADVHFAAIKTLEYFRDTLGLQGVGSGQGEVVPVESWVHFRPPRYCAAGWGWYWGNNVYFGDCDGTTQTPLTSIDIVAHELYHGVTQYSSGLIKNTWYPQSAGLSEGFSDIAGVVMEFVINNPSDRPDFTVAEELGGSKGILRYMEDPFQDGYSIDSVCDFWGQNQFHTSGPLNKAYVKSVRALEGATSQSEASCALVMGEIFLLSNIQHLTSTATYVQAASATFETALTYGSSGFPAAQLTAAVTSGWASVDIVLDADGTPSESCIPSRATLELRTDGEPKSTSFQVVDKALNQVVKSGRPPRMFTTYIIPLHLGPGSYDFIIHDSGYWGGNGLCCGGYYKLFVDDVLVAEGAAFGHNATHSFDVTGIQTTFDEATKPAPKDKNDKNYKRTKSPKAKKDKKYQGSQGQDNKGSKSQERQGK